MDQIRTIIKNILIELEQVANNIDRPVTDSDVFLIPVSKAMEMRCYDRLSRDVDMNSEEWKQLEADIKNNGIKYACRIETDGKYYWLATGNHRVIILHNLGIEKVPVYIASDGKIVCSNPRHKILATSFR